MWQKRAIQIPLKLTVMWSSSFKDIVYKNHDDKRFILKSNFDNVAFSKKDFETLLTLREVALRKFLESLGTWYVCEDLDFHVMALEPKRSKDAKRNNPNGLS